MPLVKYSSPFADFDLLPSRIFQDSMSRLFAEPNNGRPWVPPVDILETENELVLKADVPELEMKDIDVRLENGTLTIRGERKFEGKKNEGGWHRVERGYGSFERAFAIPETVNPEGVKADYKNGVLTVAMPKKEMAKPRQIKIDVTQ